MTLNDIPRKTLIMPSFPVEDLASEAEEVLGYSTTQVEVKASVLYETLAKLEIEVLDWRAVECYQLEKLFEVEQRELAEAHASSAATFDRTESRWLRSSWRMTPIEKYTEPIPSFVLNKAIQIKRALPDVEVLVEHLSNSPDPFLVVRVKKTSYSTESYYVEVWDEPGFGR